MKRSPYMLKGITLVFYDGKRKDMEVINSDITDMHPRLLKERILDGFKMMKSPPVKVELKTKWI